MINLKNFRKSIDKCLHIVYSNIIKKRKEEIHMKKYIVSQDKKTGLYYAHQKGFDYIPVSGSFSKKRTEAMEYAKMYNNLPNKVEEIEQSRKEQFEKEMELTSAEEKWIESLL